MFGQGMDPDIDESTLLEDEDLFEGPISPKDVPEIRDDVKIVANIESELASIEYLLKDIQTQKGVNQTLALEAANYSDDIKNTNINFFTKEPTQTNLVFTQESLIESIRKRFNQIYEKIKEWIRKIVAWFVGLFKKTPITDKEYEQAKQKVSINEEKNDKSWETIIKHLSIINENNKMLDKEIEFVNRIAIKGEIPSELRQSTILLSELILEKDKHINFNRVLDGVDPFIYDIVKMGPYIRLIQSLTDKLHLATTQIKGKFESIERVLDEELHGDHSEISRLNSLRVLKETEAPIYYLIDHRKLNSNDIINEINRVRSRTSENKMDLTIVFPELVLRLYTNLNELNIKKLNRDHSKSIASLIELEYKLSELEEKSNKIEYGDVRSYGNDSIVSSYRNTLFKVSAEINYLTIIQRYIKITLDQIFFMCKDTVHFSDSIYDWVLTYARHEDVKVPSNIVKVMSDIKRNRTNNFNIYKQYTNSRPF